MAIPVYLWLEDDGGAPIKGSVDVNGREGSIEVSELMHSVEQPTDPLTGKATAKRLHSSYAFMKSVDNSSAYLYKALSSGQTLKKGRVQILSDQLQRPRRGIFQDYVGKREGNGN
ncbi:Major exported protein Secreted protein hcp [Salmonella enterica subsp. arizonae]|uniref:Major exported protein Secreted protein hcp n=1 Tax=Salmonella enterica subsp. arizonae TaxID=59203 RepID=A0A379T9F6_SALER|nr:Major exported protein Secreted protein hcp [Salmonella enterica subsp. arizonae]